jgi:hypothetical protein
MSGEAVHQLDSQKVEANTKSGFSLTATATTKWTKPELKQYRHQTNLRELPPEPAYEQNGITTYCTYHYNESTEIHCRSSIIRCYPDNPTSSYSSKNPINSTGIPQNHYAR